jgi:hypothetical protein
MSLLANQTAINTLSNLFATSANSYVNTIVAGSNITVSGTSNATINAPGNSVSYANPNVVSFSVVPGATGTAGTIGFINTALYPNVNKLYRLTICYEYASATFATTPSGNITLSIFNNASPSLLLATHSVPFTANLANGDSNIGGVLTAVFRPAAAGGGGVVALGLTSLNSSGVALTSASCVATVFAVEEITDNFTLITTSGGGLTPPP